MQKSSLLVFLLQIVLIVDAYSHHVRHNRDRFKRQNGAHLYLPGSYVTSDDTGLPDAGPWGEWSSPSSCSRTCGGGVSTQYRSCAQGYRCEGPQKRHFSCNTQDCPDSSDFREQQCSEFDNVPFEGTTYQWIPYTKAPNPCELNCMPRGERFYYRHKSHVADGTRCTDDKLDVCVEGKCQPVGCDMMLGSNAREDKCRVCGGDGTSCNTVAGVLDMQDLQIGYNDILLIPEGATNINIRERQPSNNYLAVRNSSGHYHLNGNWRIDFPKTLEFSGCKFHYTRYPQGFSAPDTLSCLGPINEPLIIVLLYQDTNVGVEYEYSVPTSTVSHNTNETYVWIFGEFSPCTATCGGGYQTRKVSCAGRVTLEETELNLCDPTREPVTSQKCSEIDCEPKWVARPWEKCSAPCGVGGTQRRFVYCEQVIQDGNAVNVDDEACNNVQRPPTEQPCNQGEVCAEWHLGPWIPCDHLCGGGKQTRVVTCFRKNGTEIVRLEDEQCTEGKPETEMACNLRPCEGVDWVTSEWSGCDKCGLTSETRKVQCSTEKGEVFEDELCQAEEKPESERKCETVTKGCEYEWYASQWSNCSAKCGTGVQTRKVFCASIEDLQKAEDDKCDAAQKYEGSMECKGEQEVCLGEWFTGPWSPCSKKCGGGDMSRKIICMQGDETTERKNCDGTTIPSSSERCNPHACDEDEVMPVDSTKTLPVTDEETKETTKESTDEGISTTESGLSVSTEDDYEIIETDDCEDGEWVDDDEFEEKEGTDEDGGTSSMSSSTVETSESTESSSLDSSTDSAMTDVTTESSLATDELMLSDSTQSDTSAGTDITSALDTGSGDGETDTTGITASGATDLTSVEGSGDDSTSESSLATDTSKDTSSSESGSEATTIASTDQTTDELTTDSSTKLSSDSSTGLTSDSSTGLTSDSSIGSTSESSTELTSDSSTGLSSDSSTGLTSDGTSSSDSTTDGSTSTNPDGTSDSSSDAVTGSTSSDQTSENTSETSPTPTVETTTDMSSSTSDGSSTTDSSTTDATSSGTSSSDITSTGISTSDSSTTDVSGTSESSDMTTESGATTIEGGSTASDDLTTSTGTSLATDDTSSTSDASASTEATSESTESTGVTSESTSETGSESTEATTEFTGSTEATTEFTGSTEATTEFTGSTEASTEFTGSTEATTEVTGSTEATTEFTGSTEATTEFTGSTEETTEFTGSTTEFTGSTEETESSTEMSGSTETDIWSTTEIGSTSWTTTDITEELFTPKLRKCRRKKTPDCKKTPFGCCPDKTTPAQGPFDKGCSIPKTCAESKYGCCEDGVSAAKGRKFKGCPPTNCDKTLFGCCPDKKTPAPRQNKEGCPPPPPKCLNSKFGCCQDNVTKATGPKFEGCEKVKEDCNKSQYGCCPDRKEAATGPNYRGCDTPCGSSVYGCCEDGFTPAHGYERQGCCLASPHGCCSDNIRPAEGPNHEGCGCDETSYKCCPDNIYPARGPNNEGCGCQFTEYQCCPDNYTPAAGPDFQGCGCHTFQFGCCPDGITRAKGPHQEGCGCKTTEYGCCSDDTTPAEGPNKEGCGCDSSTYGCCLDGVTEAKGDNFEDCEDKPVDLQAACWESKEPGSCRNYTVKWYFDDGYGGCSRFYYGGCEGNGNRFRSMEECSATCVEPQGKEKCNLPKNAGPCDRYNPRWYYDKDRNHCSPFIWGGCLGNNNRFETSEECIKECVKDSSIDSCDQLKEVGPCRGTYLRYYFNNETSRCEQFYYGGCKGNSNNFPTEMACNQKCAAPNRQKDHCSLPRAQGSCEGREPRWYHDASEKRCMPFYYSGCEGNNNNFISQEHCESDCPKQIERGTCQLAAETGECANYTVRWYFNTAEKRCRQFYYGGCGGNGNNFATENECLSRCDNAPPTAPPERGPEEQFNIETCLLRSDEGPCTNDTQARWYYDRDDGSCKQFMYGGCGGNSNNFLSSDECHSLCRNAQDWCTLPKVVGPCRGEHHQYYYDYGSDTCQEFKYGGCLGNDNRFDDIASCEQRCRRNHSPVTQRQAPSGHEEPCYQPVDSGNCTGSYAAYYFDPSTQRCNAFAYSGCGGNANRYVSEEQCERQCGQFRGQDVCNLDQDPGSCNGYIVKAYYDRNLNRCAQFAYGGCEGNGNRFSSIDECERICVFREEQRPNVTSSEVCRLPVDVGVCTDSHKRWYFDESRRECLAFIYSGCGGNFNRFTSFQQCIGTCQEYLPTIPEGDNRVDSEDICESYRQQCLQTQQYCPYGVANRVNDYKCTVCSCYEPCENVNCPAGTMCGVEFNNNRTTEQDDTFIPVCRQVRKPGVCPELQSSDRERCEQECRSDADCEMELKCCSTGCGTSCLLPHSDVPAELVTPGYQPAYTDPSLISPDSYAPQIDEEYYEPEVQASEGDVATLNCAVRGNPHPRITWSKDNIMIDGSRPRYRISLDGTLQIITLHKTDSGIYLCTANNAVGASFTNQIVLNVTDGVNTAVRMLEVPDEEKNVLISLGSPATLKCYALGFPLPTVAWFKNRTFIPFDNNQYKRNRDYSLLIHQVQLSDLGIYTCQSYNGVGKAASWDVVVQAQGPVYSTNPDDQVYMKYVVDPARPQPSLPPQYAFRPPVQYPAPPANIPDYPDNNQVGGNSIVPVKTNITLPQQQYVEGSDVEIPCEVVGYPVPRVQWFRNNEPLEISGHIEITSNNVLIIRQANRSDSGVYRCEARNQYYTADSKVYLDIEEGIYIPPNCTDNPFFAKCELIVRGRYCKHEYYAKFCCESCTRAGQISSHSSISSHVDNSL